MTNVIQGFKLYSKSDDYLSVSLGPLGKVMNNVLKTSGLVDLSLGFVTKPFVISSSLDVWHT